MAYRIYPLWILVSTLTPVIPAQEGSAAATTTQSTLQSPAGKYQITVIEGASQFRRARKGRASSQAVVKITDQNDVPVAGVAVTFSIPQFVGGAQFINGSLTALSTTNAAGLASASFTTGVSGGAFNMAVAATLAPGQAVAATIPVNAAAALATGSAAGAGGATAGSAGLSGKVVAIVAVAAAGVVGGTIALTSGDEAASAPTPVSIGAPSFRIPR